VDGQAQAKDAVTHAQSVLQQIRNLGMATSIDNVPMDILTFYVRAEAAALQSRRPHSPTQPPLGKGDIASASSYFKSIPPFEVKSLLSALVHVITFMFTAGRAIAQDSDFDENVFSLSKTGSPAKMLFPVQPSLPPSSFMFRKGSSEVREAMVIVSNLQLLSSTPTTKKSIGMLVDANNVLQQTQRLKKTSDEVMRQRTTSNNDDDSLAIVSSKNAALVSAKRR
jgi:hypothetical protein